MAEGFITGRYNRGGGSGGNVNIFTGTLAEWNLLSPAQKASYTHIFTTDVINTLAGYGITNAYTKDEVDALTGGGIKTLTYTGTGTTSQTITFPEKPLMILGYTQDSDYDTWMRGIMPFFFHPSTAMLRIFWKNKSETGHSYDYSYVSAYVLTINGNSISWTGSDTSQALNTNGVEYTIYYI